MLFMYILRGVTVCKYLKGVNDSVQTVYDLWLVKTSQQTPTNFEIYIGCNPAGETLRPPAIY
jgi:hypothetical protein